MTGAAGARGLTAADLTWPGVDRERAESAAWHLYRAAQVVVAMSRHAPRRAQLERAARDHVTIARGYLGALGFEHRAGLWR